MGDAVKMYKKTKKVKFDHFFKMRLHLGVHLSLVEITNTVPVDDEEENEFTTENKI